MWRIPLSSGQKWWIPWDLYIKMSISGSSKYKRRWNDILYELEISVFDAVLWWEKTIEHPDGKISVKIPKWLQIWEQIRVPWKWFGKGGFLSAKGDLIVVPKISIPKKLSKDEEKLWKDLSNKK